MDAEQLAVWLEHQLPGHVQVGLTLQDLRVTHVLNWGGFVNHSFTLANGSTQYHLKITEHADSIEKLRRWHTVHRLLETRFRSPKIIQWVDFPEIGFAGLLCEHLEGSTATFTRNPTLVRELIAFAGNLHEDEDLQRQLLESGAEKTYSDYFVETYIDRFNADLEAIVAKQPAFVSSTLLRWMQSETAQLAELVHHLAPFQGRAVEAVHGDLNEGNVLVTGNDWFVLDWDDLALGDPAIDLAILLWPIVWAGADWEDYCPSGLDKSVKERLEFCFRAQLLDEVIDSLADYIEAAAVPSKQAEIERVKRQRHEEALGKYRRIWREATP